MVRLSKGANAPSRLKLNKPLRRLFHGAFCAAIQRQFVMRMPLGTNITILRISGSASVP